MSEEHPIWSPDGSHLAIYNPEDSAVTLLEIADLGVRNRIEFEGRCAPPVWSVDGEAFATGCDSGDDRLHLVLASIGGSRVQFEGYPIGEEIAWLPDGRVLFASSFGEAWDFYAAGFLDQVPARLTYSS